MSIQYVITCLTSAFVGMTTRTMTRMEVQAIQQQAMADYESWVYRISDDLKNRVAFLKDQIDQQLINY
jgi:hypothetical protein